MSAETHEFTVEMTCTGCSGAVERVLGKHKDKGVEKVDIDLDKQKVWVTSTLKPDDLFEIIKKTGKSVVYDGLKQ